MTGLVGIYSDPRHVIAHTDGEVRQQFTLAALRTRVLGGRLQCDNESHELRWVSQDEFDGPRIHPSMRLRIGHHFEARDELDLG